MRRRTKPASALIGAKRITDLTPDRRIPGNLVVEVNGTRFATLPADVLAVLEIAVDTELTEERFERLSRVADVEAAYLVAIRMLAARPRSVNELLRRLRDRGHNPSAAAEAVGRLESKGLVDDAAFSRHFARVRLSRGHGPSRILTDLLSRGVERRLAERAIDEVVDQEGVDSLEAARALAEKRIQQLGEELPPDRLRRRVLTYLMRRGHRGFEVREMVGEVLRNSERGAGSGEQDESV
ncbi:MAG: regulatory protein RecX [Gemmatimonadota bacterium]|nr:MAG: regulatory protein RecX [Gemmatimonadota bacterium]